MATPNMERYMTRSARSFLPAQRPRILRPTRSSKTIDPSKGKTAAAGAPLASREVAAPIQETGPEAMSIIDGEASTQPQMVTETQQPIENRGDSARYMLQTGGPRLDLSFLVPERANKAYDPSKAIGGENVPYQESKGVGGFFRRLLGDESNRMNIEAQQAQGAEWREAEKEAQKEERLLNRMREADKPTQARFEATQKAAEIAEANRVAAENKRLELEGERLGLTKQQIEDARQDRIARLQAEKEDRDIRNENMRTQNALNDAEFGLRSRVANQPRFGVHTTDKGGMTIFNQTTGEPVRTYTPGGMGMIKDAKGNMVPGMTQGGWEDYVPPVTVPKDLPDSPQVDRTTGAAPGGPRKDTMGGKLPPPEVTPMRAAAAPSPVADASLLGRFREAMPSLSFAQPSGRGYQVAPLTEGDVAQQAMGQIAYPLRAAVGQQVKGQYTNPEEVAMSMEYPMPASRFRRPSAKEQAEALAAGDLIRKMYAE